MTKYNYKIKGGDNQMISLQESLLVEAEDLLMDYSCMTPMTESLLSSYDVSEDDIQDKEKMTRAINKMKRKNDLKALLRIIEVTILAVLAYKVVVGVANVLIILAVAAILWVLHKIRKELVQPACNSVKNFFSGQITKVNTKKALELDERNRKSLAELNNILETNLDKVINAEKELSANSDTKDE